MSSQKRVSRKSVVRHKYIFNGNQSKVKYENRAFYLENKLKRYYYDYRLIYLISNISDLGAKLAHQIVVTSPSPSARLVTVSTAPGWPGLTSVRLDWDCAVCPPGSGHLDGATLEGLL